jgi:hypothetical protein
MMERGFGGFPGAYGAKARLPLPTRDGRRSEDNLLTSGEARARCLVVKTSPAAVVVSIFIALILFSQLRRGTQPHGHYNDGHNDYQHCHQKGPNHLRRV